MQNLLKYFNSTVLMKPKVQNIHAKMEGLVKGKKIKKIGMFTQLARSGSNSAELKPHQRRG